MSNILEFKNVNFSYLANFPVLNDLSFTAKSNETIGIIGANGVGKSTILKLIVGLVDNYSGTITVNNLPVTKKHYRELRKRIGYVFQDSDNQLFMNTVFEDVSFAPLNNGFSKEEVIAKTNNALEKMHIEHLANRRIQELSGGEKKLVSIATILSMTPEIILMDEPSSNLDPRNKRKLISIMNELSGLKLITSHDLDFIEKTCSRVLLINNGSIVADGNTIDIISNQALLEANGL